MQYLPIGLLQGVRRRFWQIIQQAGVNIGINEQKNILVSYIYSGIILGLATMIYASTGIISASFSSLSSIGGMFTNLLPVFVGLILARFCGDTREFY